MNERNLKHFTAENAKENGSKGGKASGEAKREKKKIREILGELLGQEAPHDDTMFIRYGMDFYSNATILAINLMDQAKSGNVRAIKLLFEVLGELDKNADEKESAEYQKGYNAGQVDVFKHMTEKELRDYMDRLANNLDIPVNERALVLPDGRVIVGESELED